MKIKRVACLTAAFLMLCCCLLTACSPVIHSERDEIRQYDWEGELENGNKAVLCFCDSDAEFTVENKDYELDIIGLCSLSDDSFVILSEDDNISYRFDYVLHGDSVELSYGGESITLEKKVEE